MLIGSSTGGPGHLQKIVQALPSSFSAAVVIAQHIADEFILSFVNQLKHESPIDVLPVKNLLRLKAGTIYVSSCETRIVSELNSLVFKQRIGGNVRYNPDINTLFTSAAKLAHSVNILGIILTGIGDDGAEGSRVLSENGGLCIAESESTAVVYGMPLQARLENEAIQIKNLHEIIQTIVQFGQ